MKWLFSILLILPFSFKAQTFKDVSLHLGPTYSYHSGNSNGKIGLGAGLESTFIEFGEKERVNLIGSFSFLQKGGFYTGKVFSYNQFGNIIATGEESYPVTMNYLSVAPLIQYEIRHKLYAKLGPRVDYFLGFKSGNNHAVENRGKEDFSSLNLGYSYAVGMQYGRMDVLWFMELVGQNDVTSSTTNTFTGLGIINNAFWFKIGVKKVFIRDKAAVSWD